MDSVPAYTEFGPNNIFPLPFLPRATLICTLSQAHLLASPLEFSLPISLNFWNTWFQSLFPKHHQPSCVVDELILSNNYHCPNVQCIWVYHYIIEHKGQVERYTLYPCLTRVSNWLLYRESGSVVLKREGTNKLVQYFRNAVIKGWIPFFFFLIF